MIVTDKNIGLAKKPNIVSSFEHDLSIPDYLPSEILSKEEYYRQVKEINASQEICKNLTNTIKKYSGVLSELSTAQKDLASIFYILTLLTFISLILRVSYIMEWLQKSIVIQMSDITFFLSLIMLAFIMFYLGDIVF